MLLGGRALRAGGGGAGGVVRAGIGCLGYSYYFYYYF